MQLLVGNSGLLFTNKSAAAVNKCVVLVPGIATKTLTNGTIYTYLDISKSLQLKTSRKLEPSPRKI